MTRKEPQFSDDLNTPIVVAETTDLARSGIGAEMNLSTPSNQYPTDQASRPPTGFPRADVPVPASKQLQFHP